MGTAPHQAWQHLLDQLAAAGEVVEQHASDDRERAEGYRHLTRLFSIAHEMLLEKADPARPEFTRWMRPWRKMMGDNPHTLYDAAMLDPALVYRMRGRKGQSAYFGVALYATTPTGGRRIAGNADDLTDDQVNLQHGTATEGHTGITLDDDGRFDLWLARERPPVLPDGASWLPMADDVSDLLVRQYFDEPSTYDGGSLREAELTLEVETPQGPPAPLTEEQVAARLRRVGDYVHDLVEVESAISAVSAMTAPESVRPIGSDLGHADVDWDAIARVQPTPAVQYHGIWFSDLGDDEAIVIEGTLQPCRYASVQLLTRWMESADWANYPVFATHRELGLDHDRHFRLIVSHRDPGIGPWLDTTGLRNASAVVRTIGAESESDLSYRRVKLCELS